LQATEIANIGSVIGASGNNAGGWCCSGSPHPLAASSNLFRG